MKWNYFLIPIFVVVVSWIGSLATTSGMEWYKTLERWTATPPDYVFGIVWTLLFVLIMISILLYWNKAKRGHQFEDVMYLFVINGVLNILWSYFFFRWHLIGWAFIDAIFLAFTALSLTTIIWRTSKTASLLLVPYVLWLSFAVFLTFSFWVLN